MKKTFAKFLSLLMTAILLTGALPATPFAYATEEDAAIEQELVSEAPTQAPAPTAVPVTEAPAPTEVPATEAPKVTETAPAVTEEAPTQAPIVTEEPSAETTEATKEVPVETPEATEAAPAETPEATEEAPAETPEVTEEAPTETPEVTEEAPTETPEATEEAPAEHEYLLFAPYQDGLAVVGCADAECVEALIPASFDGKPVLLIAEDAFLELEKLASVEIEEGVEELAKHAFHDCAALKQVKLPATLKDIAPDAFEGCPLTSIEAPANTLASAFAKAWFAESAPADEDYQMDLMVLPDIEVPNITLSIVSASDVLGIGRSLSLSAVISGTTKSTVKWAVEYDDGEPNDGLVTIKEKNRGLAATLTASPKMNPDKAPRKVTVSATLEDKTAFYHVTIRPLTKTLTLAKPGKTYLNLDNAEDSIQLIANVTPAGAAESPVQWSSNNTAIAKVDENGLVTPGHKAGTAIITVKATDGSGKISRISIRVLRAVTGISFPAAPFDDEGVLHVAAKKTLRLVPAFTPSDVKAPALVWKIKSGSNAAKVVNGVITGLTPGYATVTACLKDDENLTEHRTESAPLTVMVHPLATAVNLYDRNKVLISNTKVPITVNINDEQFAGGELLTYQLSAEVFASNNLSGINPIQAITWTSSNPRVASIDQTGKVTLVAPPLKGKATVRFTARAMDGSNRSNFVTLVFQRVVKKITIDGPASVIAGKNFTYKAIVEPTEASNPAVAWDVSNKDAGFSINRAGVLRVPRDTKGVSSIIVTATAQDGSGVKAQPLTVKVENPPDEVIRIVDQNGAALPAGYTLDISCPDTATLKLQAYNGADEVVPVVWMSSSRDAPISAEGVLTPTKACKTNITAVSLSGKKRATCTLTVISKVTGLTKPDNAYEEPITLVKGKTLMLSAVVEPKTATNKRLVWRSEDTRVATVSANGMVVAKNAGETVITASIVDYGVTYSVKFNVTVLPTASNVVITGGPSGIIDLTTLSEDDELKLTAVVTPDSAQQGVAWTSNNPRVASISADGVITAYKAGRVTFTATATDGSRKRVSRALVLDYLPEKVSILNKEVTHFAAGQRVTLFAQVLPAAASQNVVWKSLNPAYATVNASTGVVTFKNTTPNVQEVTLTVTHKQYPNLPNATDQIKVWVSPKPAKGSLVLEHPDKKYVLAYNGKDDTANTLQMNAYTMPGEQKLAYTWYSSKPSVAAVDENGLVTGVSAGTSYITVKDAYGNTARQEVQVYDAAESITILEGNAISMKAGEGITLTAKVAPDKAVQYVTWSTDSDLITLDDDNEAHTVKVTVKPNVKGEALVKVVSDADERLAATCAITISNIKATSISLDSNQNTFDAAVTPQAQLKATVQPSDASQQLNWSSSQPAVATVDQNGLLSFVGAGTTTITAAAKDGSNVSATIDITVKVSIASVAITGDTTVKAGQSITLSAKVLPEIAKDTAAWSIISGSDAAEITQDGKLTAKTVDNATEVKVKAASKKDSSKFATHTVTVLPVPRGVTITPANPVVYLGSDGTTTLKASVVPSGASQKVSWSSSDTKIATISQDGVVTIQKAKLVKGTKVSITATCVENPTLQKTVEVTVQEALLFEAELVTGGVKLTKYLGSSSNIVVPAEFDGQKVMALADGLFKGNATLTTLTLPNSITVIAKELCDGCSSLTTVNMSSDVELIGEGAFRNCTKLTTFNCK